MRRYMTRRLLQLIPLFFIVTLMTFGLMQMAPGGPEDIFLAGEDPNVRPEDIAALRKQWGLDDPIHVQYFKWLGNLLQGDLGRSFSTQRPVMEAIAGRWLPSLQLSLTITILTYLLSIPIGIIVAVRRYSMLDYVVSVFSFLGYAMPNFWVGAMLIIYVALPSGGLIPTSGFSSPNITVESAGLLAVILDRAKYMLLPVLTGVTGGMAGLVAYTRRSMLDVLKEDYVRTARAKGLAEKVVIYKHTLRNALLPIVTISSGLLGVFFAGNVVLEYVFGYPGIGALSIKAVNSKDYPMVMAFLLIGFFVGNLSSLLTDFVYVIVDPRIKYS
ncbi:MAG: ABC transporter permease [Bacillota bacterium]